ncbi:hypothetical protein EDC96DRAFT_518424 [Choanephora cucurbitarum]|nr:hypothetical protein EDC96DRAFT_518424 [Choanephora cucurbitarum]
MASPIGTTPRPFLTTQKAYQLLTKVQNASAIAFTTFSILHGAQIIAANIGGARLSNHWILLGRPFYQDQHTEGLLVTGAGLLHVLAGLGKYGLRVYWKQPTNNTHRAMGYLLIPLMGLHYYLVRYLPVQYYGDSSFIDFGYVAWGLQNRPVITYSLHTALILTATYHIVGGIQKLLQKPIQTPRSVPQHGHNITHQEIEGQLRHKRRLQKGVIAGISIALISGMVIIGLDTKKIPLRHDFEQMYNTLFKF